MGLGALFIEHPTDISNRIKAINVRSSELPWKDTEKIPYTVTGPYLSRLFERAFIDGLHQPNLRPTADEWEQALVKTVDLLQPCHNSQCEQKWYAFDNSKSPKCPFCGSVHQGKLPVLNLYSSPREGSFRSDNHRVMVYSGQSLFKWHANSQVFPNEKLSQADAKRVGYFVQHQEQWYLVNEGLPDMVNVLTKEAIGIGNKVALVSGAQILLSRSIGGRLLMVQMSGS